jgi:mono/diheme cytochrome c family protein
MAASRMFMRDRMSPWTSSLAWLAAAMGCAVMALPIAGSAAGSAASPAAKVSPDSLPRLGRTITPAEASTAGTTIFPDGRGLPAGSGTAVRGKALFEQQCANCHGAGGRGGSAPELVGGTASLTSPRPDKTIGQYWPYAPTLFDFNWRAMPMDKPGSLSADDAYAVTAYLLFAEGLVGETQVVDTRTLPAVKMPNRNGFCGIDIALPR